MSNTCWRPRVTGNTESGFTERNQTAGRTPPTEKAGTGKPERARPPFDERCRACPHRPTRHFVRPRRPTSALHFLFSPQNKMAAVTWEETAGLGGRVLTAAPDPARPFRPSSRSHAARQSHDWGALPSSLGLGLLGEARAYVSAAATLPTLGPRPRRAGQWARADPCAGPTLLTWKK